MLRRMTAWDTGGAEPAHHRLVIDLGDRQRVLARIVALIEGRGITIRTMRYAPAGPRRVRAAAVLEITCPGATLDGLVDRLAAVHGVQGIDVTSAASA